MDRKQQDGLNILIRNLSTSPHPQLHDSRELGVDSLQYLPEGLLEGGPPRVEGRGATEETGMKRGSAP